MKGGKGKRLLAAAALGVFLLGKPVHAGIIPDPVESAYLTSILVALRTWMDRAIKKFDEMQILIYNRYRNVVFPRTLFDQIKLGLSELRTIRADMERIACGWRFSPRTAYLRGLYLDPKLRLCRPGIRLIWGNDDAFFDRDNQELQDKVSALTTNVLGQHMQMQETFARVFWEDFRDLAVASSPGWANREEAKLLAAAGHVALGNAQLVNQRLELEQLDLAAERQQERLARLGALYGLARMGGEVKRPEDLATTAEKLVAR